MAIGKKSINIIILVLLVLVVLFIAISKTDERSNSHVKVFSKPFIERHIKVCLKKKHYSLDNPSASEMQECEEVAKKEWEEVLILNGRE